MSHSIVFLGTSAFAVPSLKALASDERFDIQLVITQPDRPVGRKQMLTPPPVKLAALELNLPIAQPENVNEIRNTKLEIRNFDYLVVVSYGQILSQEILDWPRVAAVNVHGSLLPKLRGASPIQHAILDGLTETGVTVQRMMKELDAGPILGQKRMEIDRRETFTGLHDKLSLLGAELLIEMLAKPLKEKEQNSSDATFCKKFMKADGIADPTTMTAEAIDRMVRALSPWPGVTWNGNKILETSLTEAKNSMPVSCAGPSILFVTKIQPHSGKPMNGSEYLRGRKTESTGK